jgi:hypothetical protein
MALALKNTAFEPYFCSRRNPFASPFWKIVDASFAEFERIYPERYAQKYGFCRSILHVVAGKVIKCGDLREELKGIRD